MSITKDKQLLGRQDLAALGITYSNQHLLYLEKIGAFPRRLRLSPQKVYWSHSEVNEYLEGCLSARQGGDHE